MFNLAPRRFVSHATAATQPRFSPPAGGALGANGMCSNAIGCSPAIGGRTTRIGLLDAENVIVVLVTVVVAGMVAVALLGTVAVAVVVAVPLPKPLHNQHVRPHGPPGPHPFIFHGLIATCTYVRTYVDEPIYNPISIYVSNLRTYTYLNYM